MRARITFLKLRSRVKRHHLLDRWCPPPSGGHTANEMTAEGPRVSLPSLRTESRLGRDARSWARTGARESVRPGRPVRQPPTPRAGGAIVGGRAEMAE